MLSCRGADGVPEAKIGKIEFTGRLVDDPDELRAVLESVLVALPPGTATSGPGELRWTDQTCSDARRLLEGIRYDVAFTASGGEPMTLVVDLAPRPQIRRIRITGNRFQIYEDEVLRRLRLRVGTTLPLDPVERDAELAEEERRVRDYLAREGFFDAEVRVTTKASAQDQVTLNVAMKKGPAYMMGTLRVSGNASVRDEVILKKIFKGGIWRRRFSLDRLQQDLESIRVMYQRDYGFPAARVGSSYHPAVSPDRRTKTVRLEIRIDEGKRIDVAFTGNKSRSDESLRKVLTFDDERSADEYEAEQSAEAIRKRYQEGGRWETRVSLEERFRTELNPNYEQVIFAIDEGPVRPVRSIVFDGARTFTPEVLRKEIQTEKYPEGTFAFLASGGYVTTVQLEQDVQALTEFYARQGFPDATVDASVALSPDVHDQPGALAAQIAARQQASGLHIRFRIVEGQRRLVERVEFVGNTAVPTAELEQLVKLRPGKPYYAPLLDDDRRELTKRYAELGYRLVQVPPAKTRPEGGGTVVTYEITEGPQFRLGHVLVRGNFKTKDWVVRDVLEYKSGRIATQRRLDRGQQRLRSTDLFNTVRILPIGDHGIRHYIVEVEEAHDKWLDGEFSAGISTDDNVFLAVMMVLPNMFGIGPRAFVSGEFGLQNKRALGTFSMPDYLVRKLIGIGYQLDLTGYYRQEDTERFGNLESKGLGVTFSRRFPNGVLLSFRYDWNRFGRQRELVRPAGPSESIERTPVSTTTASFGPAIIWDKRTPAGGLSPTGGFYIGGSAAIASRYLLGTDDFLKFSLQSQYVQALRQDKTILLRTSLRYDHGIPLGGAVLLPEVERYTAGGDNSVRGFEEDRLLTEVVSSPLEPIGGVTQYRVVPAGGNIRALHSLELEFRIGELLFPVASAIFLDTGMVVNSYRGFRLSNIRQGVGIALFRWMIPGGSVSLEYALPLAPRLGDDPTGRFHFTVGWSI